MTKIIKVLGTGCAKCKSLTKLVNEIVVDNKIDAEVIKVEDIMEIIKYDIMSTPALVIDEEVIIKGRVPSKSELQGIIIDYKINVDFSK